MIKMVKGYGFMNDYCVRRLFDACDYAQVVRMLVDVRVLADTLLLERC